MNNKNIININMADVVAMGDAQPPLKPKKLMAGSSLLISNAANTDKHAFAYLGRYNVGQGGPKMRIACRKLTPDEAKEYP